MSEDITNPVELPRRGPGRPRKILEVAPVERPSVRHQMKAKPNWDDDDIENMTHDNPDRLKIDPAILPDGMSFQWVTDSVYGQQMPQHRAKFEKRGWTPIHQQDFENVFDGMFMPKGMEGEIKVDGMVLMTRPEEMTRKAKIMEQRQAQEAIRIKEQALTGGDLNISLDSQHPSAIRTNRINKTMERIQVPDDR
jgi:hypothetical protein